LRWQQGFALSASLSFAVVGSSAAEFGRDGVPAANHLAPIRSFLIDSGPPTASRA
jgi:hypothetical protein